MRHFVIICTSLSLLTLACGKSEDAKPGGDSPAAAAAKGAKQTSGSKGIEGGGEHVLTLSLVDDLKITVPPGTEAEQSVVGEGMLVHGDAVALDVMVAGDMHPRTADDAREEAAMFNGKNVSIETLPDGWALSFDNEGQLGNGEPHTNYFASVRRTIAGKDYYCHTTTVRAEQRDAGLAACKSLRK